MKNGIGLYLLFFSLSASAGSNGILHLMGRVPATYSVKLEVSGDKVVPVVRSNHSRILPQVKISKEKNLHYVSVVHP